MGIISSLLEPRTALCPADHLISLSVQQRQRTSGRPGHAGNLHSASLEILDRNCAQLNETKVVSADVLLFEQHLTKYVCK